MDRHRSRRGVAFLGFPVLVIGIAAVVYKREGSVRRAWITAIILFALATFAQFRGQ